MARLRPDAADSEIIAAILGGDRSAFSALVQRYEGAVARTIIGMLGPGDEAEEAGQTTFIKVYDGLATFKGTSSLKTFITRIAINTALDALRRRKRRIARFLSPAPDEDRDVMERIPDPRDVAGDHERAQLVQFALSQLKPDFRAVAVLRLLHGYSAEEVADILGVSQGTVFSRLSRARSQLQDILTSEMAHG